MERENIVNLVESAQAGHSEAFSELFTEYKNDVYSIAMRETKDRALSDDIVQETFIEAFLKINDLKNPASFPAWLKIMAYHQCTRHYKKKETVHETVAIENDEGWSAFDTVEETNASFIPDKALDQKEFKETIQEMIDDLPDAQRAALHMFYYEEMPLKVIAKVQGVSVNTANTRLNRGRLAMKDSIEKYEKKHGVRLHSIAFFPFFRWLLKGTEEVMSDKATTRVAQTISAKTNIEIGINASSVGTSSLGAGAYANSGAATAGTGLKSAASGVITKVIAGVAAVSIAVGGVTLYQSKNNDSKEVIASQITQMDSDTYGEQDNDLNAAIPDTIPVDPLQDVYSKYEELLVHGISQTGFTITYYAYLDIDLNGVPELVVADYDGTPNSWTTCEVYTYLGGNMVYCGATNSNYDYLYHVNGKYILGKHRMGNQFISTDGYFNTTIYHWNDEGDRNDPAISHNVADWEYITKEKFEYYNLDSGGFITQKEIIELQRNNFLQTTKLSQILDFSKAWSHQEETTNGKYTTVYSFDEAGNFYCMFGFELSDIITCYQGTYTFDGKILELCYQNNQGSFICDYLFDSITMEITQLTDTGIMDIQQKGDTYQLHVDEWNDPSRVKDMYNLVIGE